MSFAGELARQLADLEREVRRIRAALVRTGSVASVDTKAGTLTVKYLSGVTSAPMPWFQRGSEHRPPVAGEHVLVLDPSLQGTSAIAIAGHPSAANPPPEGGGDKVVLHSEANGHRDLYESGTRSISAKTLQVTADAVNMDTNEASFGKNASDFAALASLVDQYIMAIDLLFRSWTPVAQDGGAALKAAFQAAFPQAPQSVAALHVKIS